jgi:hypothetical protein
MRCRRRSRGAHLKHSCRIEGTAPGHCRHSHRRSRRRSSTEVGVAPHHPAGVAVAPHHPAGVAVAPHHPAGAAADPHHPAGAAADPHHPAGAASPCPPASPCPRGCPHQARCHRRARWHPGRALGSTAHGDRFRSDRRPAAGRSRGAPPATGTVRREPRPASLNPLASFPRRPGRIGRHGRSVSISDTPSRSRNVPSGTNPALAAGCRCVRDPSGGGGRPSWSPPWRP